MNFTSLIYAVWPIFVLALIFILFDLISGILAGIKEKQLQSIKLRQGLWHKLGFILVIGFAIVLECALLYIEFPYDVPSTSIVCIYIILTECVSIFENLCILNPSLINSPFGSIFKNDDKIIEAETLENENESENIQAEIEQENDNDEI